jgi:hypothetical protein
MDQNNDKPKGGLQIPCVYCSHSNPADFRFCGMCGKALPDLVKQAAKVSEGMSGSPLPGSGIGMAGRPPAQPPRQAPVAPPNVQAVPPVQPPVKPVQHAVPPRPNPAARQENPNRDLSYLLHDDHTPVRTNRTPFVVGTLILVAVAGFFAMRGGKTTPASNTGGDTTTAQSLDASPAPDATSPAKTEEPKPEHTTEAKNEAPTPEPKTVEPDTPPSPAVETPKPVVKAAPRPTRARSVPQVSHKPALRKPSPSRHAVAASESADADEVAPNPSNDCEKQLPALRRGAARGDIRSRTGLGLMYYAGRCVPRDLPTAYKWYALALHAEPDNSQVSAQLEAIWKQMSPAERQLALKSQ